MCSKRGYNIKKLLKKIIEIGWKCIEVFDSNPIRYSEIKVGPDQSFEVQKESNITWLQLIETKEFKNLLKYIKIKTGINPDIAQEMILPYVYEIITEYAQPPKKEEADEIQIAFGHVRPSKEEIESGIEWRSSVLLYDFSEERSVFEAVAPLLYLQSDEQCIDFGPIGRIRPLRYSERKMYKPRYPNAIIPYGPENVDMLVELEASMKTEELNQEKNNLYVQRAGNIVIAIRLIFSGEAGLVYVTANNHFTRMKKSKTIGDIEHWHRFTIRAFPGLIYGKKPSHITSNLVSEFCNLVKSLDVLRPNYVWRAIVCFGLSSRSNDQIDSRIIDLAIAFEALLGADRGIASRRAATLVSEKPGYHKETEDFLHTLWKARDAFAHGYSIDDAIKRAKTDLSVLVEDSLEILKRCLLISISINQDDRDFFWKCIDTVSESVDSRKGIIAHIPKWATSAIGKIGPPKTSYKIS